MDKSNIFIILWLFALAIYNSIVYSKFFNYMLICAGVTKEDAQRYVGRHNNTSYSFRGYRITSQDRLTKWLKQNAKHPKEFKVMYSLCNAVVFLSFVSVPLVITILFLKNIFADRIILVPALLTGISLIITIAGFTYGRKAALQFEDYFSGAEYIPYEYEEEISPYEVDDSNELYSIPEDSGRNTKSLVPVLRIIPVIVFAVIVLVIVLISKMYHPAVNYNDSQTEMQTQEEIRNFEMCVVNGYRVDTVLQENGFRIYSSYEDIINRHPGYNFVNGGCITAGEDGLDFNFYTMQSEDDAKLLYYQLMADIDVIYNTGSCDEKQTDSSNFGFYSMENEKAFAVAVRTADKVIYAYCDSYNTQWLKSILKTIECFYE